MTAPGADHEPGARVPRRLQAPPGALRPRTRRAGLGHPARSLPPLRRCASSGPAAARGRAARPLGRPVPTPGGAGPGLRPGHPGRPPATLPRALRLEVPRRQPLGPALQPFQRQSASHRRLSDQSRLTRAGGGRLPLSTRTAPLGAARRGAAGLVGRGAGGPRPASTGARRGSTASVPSATASTTAATPWRPCPMPRPLSAGRCGC